MTRLNHFKKHRTITLSRSTRACRAAPKYRKHPQLGPKLRSIPLINYNYSKKMNQLPRKFFDKYNKLIKSRSVPRDASPNRSASPRVNREDDDASPGSNVETIHFDYPGSFRVHADDDEYDSDDTRPLPPQHPFWSMEFVVYQPCYDSSDEMD